jgi:NAD(P)-dependent dehydrogenase (short-subunit alcohol dehydrogenase family)
MTVRHALVTGGTRGIGLGVTEALLAAGWRVTATGLTAAEVETCPPREGLEAAVLDVTDDAAVTALVGGLPVLHALVNCAGTVIRGGEFELANFQRVIDVNLVGTMRLCVACRSRLAATGGSIVNTASMLSYFGGPLVPAYTASKGGVAQLTKSLAAAWAGDGIRVNAVAPGWIETELTRSLREDPARDAAILGRTPQRRWGHPREVGEAVAFLVSEQAGFITGTLLNVDGGYAAV